MTKYLTDSQKEMIMNYAEHDGEVTLTEKEIKILLSELEEAKSLIPISRNAMWQLANELSDLHIECDNYRLFLGQLIDDFYEIPFVDLYLRLCHLQDEMKSNHDKWTLKEERK